MSNTRKANPDVAALLAAARLPERTVDLCLRGDLQAEWEMLQRDLDEAKRVAKASASLAGEESEDVAALAERMQALEATMAESVLTVRLRALNRKAFQDLLLAHPPRKDDQRDKLYGFNVDTFNDALVRASCVDPEFNDDQWDQFTQVITSGQHAELSETAGALNHSRVDIPFSSSGSPRAPTSAGK